MVETKMPIFHYRKRILHWLILVRLTWPNSLLSVFHSSFPLSPAFVAEEETFSIFRCSALLPEVDVTGKGTGLYDFVLLSGVHWDLSATP